VTAWRAPGVTEVQTITTQSNGYYVKEVQTVHIIVNGAGTPLQVTVSYRPAVTGIQASVPVLYLDSSSVIKTKLQTLPGLTNVTVSVTVGANNDRFWGITFESVTGDVPALTVVGDTGFDISVDETTKGVSPFGPGDTFLVSYQVGAARMSCLPCSILLERSVDCLGACAVPRRVTPRRTCPATSAPQTCRPH
jgi:hypothetical protein